MMTNCVPRFSIVLICTYIYNIETSPIDDYVKIIKSINKSPKRSIEDRCLFYSKLDLEFINPQHLFVEDFFCDKVKILVDRKQCI